MLSQSINFRNQLILLKRALPFLWKSNDVELDQARVRVTIECVGLLYLVFSYYAEGFDKYERVTVAYLCIFITIALFLYVLIRKFPGHYVARKLFVSILDNFTITLLMYRLDASGAIWFPMFLWVTIGTGFRYGRLYLFFSQFLSILGFLLLTLVSPFWSNIQGIQAFFAVLVLIPLYATSLIGRLTVAIEKAQEASEAKSRFVSNMSHEIRTPLHGIIGIGELLSLRNYDEEYRSLCEKLSKSAQLLLQLLNDVLDFSKIESGKFEIKTETFDLRKAVHDIATVMFSQVGGKNIHTEVLISEDIEKHWIGDVRHIKQVLMNLLGNAIKFTTQGSITLSVQVIDQKKEHATVRFTVRDSGVGMTPEFLGKIFERFAQADIGAQVKYKGTGLGTTIAKQLVEAMGGQIQVASALNVGTTFWFDLPLKNAIGVQDLVEEEQALAGIIENTFYNRSKLQILIAEDNETNQMIITKILEKAGFSFDLVNDGESALDMLLDKSYDVALLDMQMPHLSGLEVYKAYKMINHADENIKFIMLSANVDQEIQKEVIKAGFAECLSKPIVSSKLLTFLDNQTSSKSNEVANVELTNKNRIPDENLLIDSTVLTELAEFASYSGFLMDVVNSFDDEMNKNLAGMETAFLNAQFMSLQSYAHAMRGTAANVGAVKIKNIAAEIETMPCSGKDAELLHIQTDLRDLHFQSIKVLRELANKLEQKQNFEMKIYPQN